MNTILTLRLYFRGEVLVNIYLPAPVSDDLSVPLDRPPRQQRKQPAAYQTFAAPASSGAESSWPATTSQEDNLITFPQLTTATITLLRYAGADTFSATGSSSTDFEESDDRLRRLMEIREQVDLITKFHGVVPNEEVNQRMRELYAALPPPPSCTSSEKYNSDDDCSFPPDKKPRAK